MLPVPARAMTRRVPATTQGALFRNARRAAGLLVLAALACAALAPAPARAQATVDLVSNITGALTVPNNRIVAQRFTTGRLPAGATHFVLSGVRLTVHTAGTTAVRLKADSAGLPGALLATLSGAASSTGTRTFTAPAGATIALAPDTRYWLTANENLAGAHGTWAIYSRTHSGSQTGLPGWDIDDTAQSYGSDRSVWGGTGRILKMTLRGHAATGLAPPAGLTASNGSASGTVALRWTAIAGATGYDVQRKVQGTGACTSTGYGAWTSAGAGTSRTVTGLADGVRYCFRMRSRDANGPGRPSAPVHATPLAAPAAPAGLAATAGNGRVTLAWDAAPRASAYEFQSKAQASGACTAAGYSNWSSAGTGTRHAVTPLVNATRYCFRVRAANGRGNSAATAAVTATPSGTLAAPAGLAAETGNRTVRLAWTPVPGASSHRYRYKTTGAFSAWTTAAAGDTVTVSSLSNGTEHTFEVAGFDAANAPGAAAEVKATPAASGVPTGVTAVAGPMTGQVTLGWTAGVLADSYEFQSKPMSAGACTASGYGAWRSAGTGTRHVVTGLTFGNRYCFRVRTVASGTGSAPSAAVHATPMTAPEALNPRPGADLLLLYGGSFLNRPASGAWQERIAFTSGRTLTASLRNADTSIGLCAHGTTREVGWYRSAAPTTRLGTVVGNATAVNHTPTAPGEYLLLAYCKSGANYSTAGNLMGAGGKVTLVAPPRAPTRLAAAAGNARVRLDWTPATGGTPATGFEVQRKPLASGACGTGSYGAWTAVANSTGATASHAVTPLVSGNRYCFRVRAVSGSGTSGANAAVHGAPSAPAAATPGGTNSNAFGAPTVSGTAQVGHVLSAAKGTISDSDGTTRAEYAWQWIRTASGTDSDISGATGRTYRLVAADSGNTVKVKATFTDDGGNAESRTSAAHPSTGTVAADTTAPTVARRYPADGATGVARGASLVLTFSEPVEIPSGTTTGISVGVPGAANRQSLDPSMASQVALADDGLSVTIDPPQLLSGGANQSVRIDGNVFRDKAATPNAFAGIGNDTDWNFTTAAADTTDPLIFAANPATPASGATNVWTGTNLVLRFNEPMVKGSGNITLSPAGGTAVQIPVTGANVTVGTGANAHVVTIDPASDLIANTVYSVQVAATAFDDRAGNSYAGLAGTTAWRFTTDGTNPSTVRFVPENAATAVAVDASLSVTFSEAVKKGTGNITLTPAGGTAVSIPVTGNRVSISGAKLFIDPEDNLLGNTGYTVNIPATAVDDRSGNSYAGGTWSFTTGAEKTPPALLATTPLTPADGAADVLIDASLVLRFTEPVRKGTGTIVIRPASGSDISIDVTSSRVTVGTGPNTHVVTIDPPANLANGTDYHVRIPATAFTDAAGNRFAGIRDATTWDFDTRAGATTILTAVPEQRAGRAHLGGGPEGVPVRLPTTCLRHKLDWLRHWNHYTQHVLHRYRS